MNNIFYIIILIVLYNINIIKCSDDIITWKNIDWVLKDSDYYGPGPNKWSKNNVWIDNNNYLHLKITNNSNIWKCAEVTTLNPLNFTSIQWYIDSQLDEYDPNIVLGLFFYGNKDYIDEIDIEYSKWGDPNEYNSVYSVYPANNLYTTTSHFFNTNLYNNSYTTQRIHWKENKVIFQSLNGFINQNSNDNLTKQWIFSPSNYNDLIPSKSLYLHMNLWLVSGNQPTNNQTVEVIFRDINITYNSTISSSLTNNGYNNYIISNLIYYIIYLNCILLIFIKI